MVKVFWMYLNAADVISNQHFQDKIIGMIRFNSWSAWHYWHMYKVEANSVEPIRLLVQNHSDLGLQCLTKRLLKQLIWWQKQTAFLKIKKIVPIWWVKGKLLAYTSGKFCMLFCHMLIFFKIDIFENVFQEHHQCQTVWIQIRPEILSSQIWVQTVYIGYPESVQGFEPPFGNK